MVKTDAISRFFGRAPKAEEVTEHVAKAGGNTPDYDIRQYKEAGEMADAAEAVGVVDQSFRTTIHEQATPLVVDDVKTQVAKAGGNTPDYDITQYKEAGEMATAAETSGIVHTNFRGDVQTEATPMVLDDVVTQVKKAGGNTPDYDIRQYKEAGEMADAAQAANIVNSSLRGQVQEQATPLVTTDVDTQVDKAHGFVPNYDMTQYKEAGEMADAAQAANIVTPAFRGDVRTSVNPKVSDDIVGYVGKGSDADVLARKYPAGGDMLNAAATADIIDRPIVTGAVSEQLQGGLTKAQIESFRSGNWDRLALQKVAEQCRLFTPDVLATVKSMILVLLENSIKAGISWGDRKDALEQVLAVQSTGLIDVGEVKSLREKYLLLDGLISAKV